MTDHPALDQLRAYLRDELARAPDVAVAAHLGRCPECAAVADRLAVAERAAASPPAGTAVPAGLVRSLYALGSAVVPPATAGAAAFPVPVPGYDVLRELVPGGYDRAFKARDRLTGSPACVLFVSLRRRADFKRATRFYRAVRSAGRAVRKVWATAPAAPPKLVRVIEAGAANGWCFLCTEWAGEETWADRGRVLAGGPAAAVRELAAVARAVHAMHTLPASDGGGFVHGAIHPGNLLVTAGGARLTGYGLAYLGDADCPPGGAFAPAPRAPELADRGREPTPAADVFGLGVVLRAVAAGPAGEGSERGPAAELNAGPVWERCLSADPAGRYESAAQVADALEELVRRS